MPDAQRCRLWYWLRQAFVNTCCLKLKLVVGGDILIDCIVRHLHGFIVGSKFVFVQLQVCWVCDQFVCVCVGVGVCRKYFHVKLPARTARREEKGSGGGCGGWLGNAALRILIITTLLSLTPRVASFVSLCVVLLYIY